MNAKATRRLPAAQPLDHHSTADRGIEFHCKHPFDLSMPISDMEQDNQDRYTFAPPSEPAPTRFSGTLCLRDL